MKIFLLAGTIAFTQMSWAAQKAKIINPAVDVYSSADFDSDILDTVDTGQTYLISDKVYGPFFRIKLKSGKIGYIPDTDVDVEGKGRIKPRSENQDEEDPFLNDMDDPPAKDKNKKTKKTKPQEDEEEDDELLRGISFQLINYHEDTLGGVQVDDLPALGYKSIGDFAWEVFASIKAPSYYSQKLKASARAFNLWALFGMSNEIPFTSKFGSRYGGGLMGHISLVNVETKLKNYELQDATVGGYLEGAFLLRFSKIKYDLSMKYIIDKQSYGALAFTVFF